MAIQDGAPVNAAYTNSRLLSKTQDDATVGKLSLNNGEAVSGSNVTNAQRNINQIASQLGVSTNDVYNALITWASTVVGSSSSSAVDKIEAIVTKFRDIEANGGHTHDGTDGNGPQLSVTDLADYNDYYAEWQSFDLSGASGVDDDVTSDFSLKLSGGDASTAGVITDAPLNRVEIVSDDGTFVEDGEGQRVYGRLTEAAGTWTLSYYTLESGVETSHNLSTQDIMVLYREVFTSANRPTIPSNPFEFGTLDVTADVVDATASLRGVVNTGSQTFGGDKIFNDSISVLSELIVDELTDNTATGTSADISDASKTIVKLTDGSLVSVSSISDITNNQLLIILNDTGNDISILNDSAGTAAQGIITGTGNDLNLANGASLFLFYSESETRWQVVGGTGGGSVNGVQNFIVGGDAEDNDFTIINRYEDAAGVAPVDGTGSPGLNNVVSVSSTDPLDGTYSFIFSKISSSDSQGTGWSIDFSVPNYMKGHICTVNFEYLINSGNFAAGSSSTNSDIMVYIYDVTNAELVPLSDYKLYSNSSSISDTYIGKFQVRSNSTSYRLIWHIATTTTELWSLKVDRIRAYDQDISINRSLDTDWVSYTPSTQGFGTISSSDFEYRLEAGDLLIRGSFVSGTSTAVEGRVDLPTGFTGKALSSIKSSGLWFLGATATSHGGNVLIESGSSYITFSSSGVFSNVSTNAMSKANGSDIASSGNSVNINARIPLAGYGSNISVVPKDDGRPVILSVKRNTNQTVSDANDNIIVFNSVIKDSHSSYNTSTGTWTCPVSGDYRIYSKARVDNITSGTLVVMTFYINGVATPIASKLLASNNTSFSIDSEVVYPFRAGDTVVVTMSSSDASYTINGASGAGSFTTLNISKSSDPRAIGIRPYQTISSKSDGSVSWPFSGGAWGDVTSITLPAGNWEISSMLIATTAGAPGGNVVLRSAVTTTSGNSATGVLDGENASRGFLINASGYSVTMCVVKYSVSISTSTTYYLKGFSDTATNLNRGGYSIIATRWN